MVDILLHLFFAYSSISILTMFSFPTQRHRALFHLFVFASVSLSSVWRFSVSKFSAFLVKFIPNNFIQLYDTVNVIVFLNSFWYIHNIHY